MAGIVEEITCGQISKLLKYDRATGELFWLSRTPDMFQVGKKTAPAAKCARWNARYAGKEAFTAHDGRGYRHGAIFDRRYHAHRVIWLLHTGEWPADQIDHINGNRSDNRIENLRAVSNAENQKNARMRRDNTSGLTGICWHKCEQKWMAHIGVDGRKKYLGLFSNIADAAVARRDAEVRFGFHENHGRHADTLRPIGEPVEECA